MGNTPGSARGDASSGTSHSRIPTRLARPMTRRRPNAQRSGAPTASPTASQGASQQPPPSPSASASGSVSPAASRSPSAASQSQSQSQSQPPSPSASPSPSPTRPSPTKKASSNGEDVVISNWKLFNDLENREEHSVLELSIFLDALSKYLPDVDGLHKTDSQQDLLGPPDEHPSLGKTVSAQVVGQIDIANMYVQAAELEKDITLKYVEELLEACKNGRKIPRNVIVRVINEAMALFRKLPTLVEFTVAPANHITIIGDLHGQLDDLLLIFRENGLPSDTNPYLFNGDFVDRGDRGVEIAVIIYLFKILYPNHVLVNRGNHEENSITQVFGFMKECEVKYDRFIFDLFCESFKWLPLATLIDRRILVLHGGVTRELLTLREFNLLERNEYDLTRYRTKPKHRSDRERFQKFTAMRDILWSDPKATKGWEENKRGAGIAYGPDVVQKFMAKNKLSLIVRSHECVPRGFDWPFLDKGMLVTLFSASNYCGKANNLGCFMRIPSGNKEKPAFFQYMASAESRDMAISNLDMLFSLIIEHQADLLIEFQQEDKEQTGKVSAQSWAAVMEDVLDLSLDWNALQPLLTALDKDGMVPYESFLARYNAEGAIHANGQAADDSVDPERLKRRSAFNSLYRHRARLEALFRALDRDGNGIITLDELENGIQLLNQHLPPGTKPFSTDGADYMRMMDFSHDNEININEFLEGFRINAKLTVHAKWKRARKKIKALSAIGALRQLSSSELEPPSTSTEDSADAPSESSKRLLSIPHGDAPPVMTRHGSVQMIVPSASAAVNDVQLDLDEGIEEVDSDNDSDEDDGRTGSSKQW